MVLQLEFFDVGMSRNLASLKLLFYFPPSPLSFFTCRLGESREGYMEGVSLFTVFYHLQDDFR